MKDTLKRLEQIGNERPLILVVDDNEIKRYSICQPLKRFGYEIIEASTGKEALAMAHSLPVLIVLDVNLPDISGFEVCKLLRRDPLTASIPILHISATYVEGDYIAEGLEGGADGYLTQPLDDVELVATVRALLRCRAAEQRYRILSEALQLMNNNLSRELEERRRLETLLKGSYAELDKFTSIASHDMKEPLRTMRLHLQILQSLVGENLNAEGKNHLIYTIDASEKLVRLIDSLLEYSKVSNKPLATETVNLTTLLEKEVLPSLASAIKDSCAKVEVGELPTLLGDELQLSRLFQNLISNSIKYRSPARSPHVKIQAQKLDKNWQITVMDNGMGFDTKYAKKIFDVFQRLHSKEIAGSGIGLAVCRRVVERHGGEIHAHSVPDFGSEFTFTLPDSH